MFGKNSQIFDEYTHMISIFEAIYPTLFNVDGIDM